MIPYQFAVLVTIRKIQNQPDYQPDQKTHPVGNAQFRNKIQIGQQAKDRNQRQAFNHSHYGDNGGNRHKAKGWNLMFENIPEGMAGSNFYGEETGNAFPVKIKQQQDNDEPNQR